MKVLVDTNVILDVWLAREPFWQESSQLLARIERKNIKGFIAPTTVSTLHYLGKKVLGESRARDLLENLLSLCIIGKTTSETFKLALKSKVSDFEDAVIEVVSQGCGVDVIATRNVKDFRNSTVPAKEPYLIIKG